MFSRDIWENNDHYNHTYDVLKIISDALKSQTITKINFILLYKNYNLNTTVLQ